MATNDREQVLAVVNGFLASISDQRPPFLDSQKYILSESLAVLSRPDRLVQCTLGVLVTRVEEKLARFYDAGAKSIVDALVEPGPDVWISGRLAAVWSGYALSVDGKEMLRGATAITLFKLEDGWKISAIADDQWNGGEEPPVFVQEVPREMIEPCLELSRLSGEERWDGVIDLLLPGSGATHASFPHVPSTLQWPEFVSGIRETVEKAKPGRVEQKFQDWEGRVCGDMGLVWTPFVVSVDGKVTAQGHTVFTTLKKDGKWLISGAQDG